MSRNGGIYPVPKPPGNPPPGKPTPSAVIINLSARAVLAITQVAFGNVTWVLKRDGLIRATGAAGEINSALVAGKNAWHALGSP
jgi:hypothetical protein